MTLESGLIQVYSCSRRLEGPSPGRVWTRVALQTARGRASEHKLCQNLVVVLVNVPWPPKLGGTEKGESHDFRTWSHPGLHRSW